MTVNKDLFKCHRHLIEIAIGYANDEVLKNETREIEASNEVTSFVLKDLYRKIVIDFNNKSFMHLFFNYFKKQVKIYDLDCTFFLV